MSRDVPLVIGGLGADFRCADAALAAVISRRYCAFRGRGRGFSIEASSSPVSGGVFRPKVTEAGGRLVISRGDFKASLRGGRGMLEIFPAEQPVDAFLRALLAHSLLRRGGFMLHSAGLQKNGRAFLFPGRSGAGKSTLSRLAAVSGRAELISDEINMVALERGRFVVYGSPFWGEMRADGRPGRWPLGGIFLPRKARAASLKPCRVGEAVRTLLRCIVSFERSPSAGSLALANAAAAASACAGIINFTKDDGGFLDLI